MPLPSWDLQFQNWPFFYALYALVLLSVGHDGRHPTIQARPGPGGHPRRRGQGRRDRCRHPRLQEPGVHGQRRARRHGRRRLRLLRLDPQRELDVRHRVEHADRAGGPPRRPRHGVGTRPRCVHRRPAHRGHQHHARRGGRRGDQAPPVRRADHRRCPADATGHPAHRCRPPAPMATGGRVRPHRQPPRRRRSAPGRTDEPSGPRDFRQRRRRPATPAVPARSDHAVRRRHGVGPGGPADRRGLHHRPHRAQRVRARPPCSTSSTAPTHQTTAR